jgi:pilus assembly protein Flp/PilA
MSLPDHLTLQGAALRVLELRARCSLIVTNLLPSSRGQRGQGMVEYGLILLLVAIALIGALIALQGPLKTIFNNVINSLQGGTPG